MLAEVASSHLRDATAWSTVPAIPRWQSLRPSFLNLVSLVRFQPGAPLLGGMCWLDTRRQPVRLDRQLSTPSVAGGTI